MSELGRRLRRIPLPEEAAARERARRTVLAAHAALPPRRRRHGRTTALAFTGAVLGLAALTGPGQAVVGAPARAGRDLVNDVVPPAPTPPPVPAHRGTRPP